MVIKTTDIKVRDEILNWLAPLGIVSSVVFRDIAPQATDRNADWRRSARLEPVLMMAWTISIIWEENDDRKLMFLLMFGEHI